MRGHRAALGLLLLLGACKDEVVDDSEPVSVGPTLAHTPPAGPFYAGDDVPLSVSAEDSDGVASVTLYYRVSGNPYWESEDMSAGEPEWTATLAGASLDAPGVEYYFKATDGAGVVSYLPEGQIGSNPFLVPIAVQGLALPYFEDFEVESGQNNLFDLGWAADAGAFSGYLWGLTLSNAYSGDIAVGHTRGSTEVGQLDDWLISPPLDFSSLDQVQVSWYEYGANVADADHTLYVSTGSRMPDDGDYVEVMALPTPDEGAWARTRAINLSDWAGASTVYLAWRYTGASTDDWFIDDVSVRSLTLDLESALTVAPDPVYPGETARLELGLENLADVGGSGLSVTLVVPDGAGEVAEETVSVGAIGAQGTATAAFSLDIDPSWPANSYMPLAFTVSDGTDTWSFEHTLTVGLASTAQLDLTLNEAGVVQVSLGQGDPDAPSWESDFWAVNAAAGALSLTADITDYYASLPPAPGADRWFARIHSGASGIVTSFELHFDGEVYDAGDPVSLTGDEDTLVYVPEPPVPALVSAVTSPSTLAPGSAGVSLSIGLRNDGADPVGPVSVTLVSADPDVTVLDGGPLELASFPAGSSRSLSGAFSFDVSSAHVDSLPVSLSLEMTDGVDSWSLPVDLDVPWPVLPVTGVEIDDGDGGDGDGLLEPGEGATLTLEVSNVGGLNAFGIVSGTLELLPSSTAAATVSPDAQTFGQLTVGNSRDDDFEVSVDAGASLGQTLDLMLHLTDGTNTYDSPLQIVLGELPWIRVSVTGDAMGDNLGYTFDLANVYYRCDGTTFEMEFEAHSAFDPATTFVEMWGIPTSSSYYYFRLVLQSGIARLQGYSGGFVGIADPDVVYPSATRVRLSWPVSVMLMNTNGFRAGFGAGWCGSETGSYCDHFPDGWGYYYSGFTSANYYSFRW